MGFVSTLNYCGDREYGQEECPRDLVRGAIDGWRTDVEILVWAEMPDSLNFSSQSPRELLGFCA